MNYSMTDITGINLNLYHNEESSYDSFDSILDGFKVEFEDAVRNRLKILGMKYNGMSYYHPKSYNHEGDDIDIDIDIISQSKIIQAVLDNKDKIQAELDKNTSYSGYISHTCNKVDDVINKIQTSNEIDIIALSCIINMKFDFDIHEYIIYDEGYYENI